MPRPRRFICAGVPHHVTQRGNRRGQVFFEDADYLIYLHWLREYCIKYEIAILAYCLMTNHVHLVLVPDTKVALSRVLSSLHARLARRVNRANEWTGHLWQARYFSSALDERHFWAAIRYVERNPVRAAMVARAEDYPWSSAAAHCGLGSNRVLTTHPYWDHQFAGIGDWSKWLAEADDPVALQTLRDCANHNLPCGSDEFMEKLAADTGQKLPRRSRGRPARKDGKKGA
jgi:putative transposase